MTKDQIVRGIGALGGLLVGVLFLTIGFWKTMLLVALAFAGWMLMGGYPVLIRWLGKLGGRLGGDDKDE